MTTTSYRALCAVLALVATLVAAVVAAVVVLPSKDPAQTVQVKVQPPAAVTYLEQDSGYQAAPDDTRPNVVFILTDDMRADELRWMPQTQRLLGPRNGRAFPHAISPHPLCCPARAQLVTGQYAQNNGVQSNDGTYGGYQALRDPDNNIGSWLESTGYATSWHGKYLNGYDESDGAEPGWTEWDPLMGGIYSYTVSQFWGEPSGTRRYITDELTRRTVGTINRFAGPGSPFMVVVNHTAPHYTLANGTGDELRSHDPPIPESAYAKLYPRAQAPAVGTPAFNAKPVYVRHRDKQDVGKVNYHFRQRVRSLRSVDDSVAQTVAALRRTGELDNTVIIFTSDNGYQLGEHRYLTKNVLYRESLDVPLLIRGPGVKPGVSSPIVSLVDLPATILDLAGVAAGRPQDGASLKPLLRGARNPDWRTATLVQVGSEPRGRIQPGWDARGVQTDRYLYYEWVNHPRRKDARVLFDRRRDRHELVNLARDPRYRVIARLLRGQARRLEGCAGSRCNVEFPRLPRPRRR